MSDALHYDVRRVGIKRYYRVTKKLISIWLTKYGEIPSCKVCGEPFKVGDFVESRQRNRKYHTRCLESKPIYVEVN